jgi:2'-5' RNA ligase
MGRFFIGLTLPRDFSKKIDEWRLKASPTKVKIHPPHLTLVSPFSSEGIDKIKDGVADFSSTYRPIGLSLLRMGQFQGSPETHVVVQTTPDLLSLHTKINKVAGLNPRWQFTPHITLGKLTSGKSEQARRELTGKIVFADSLVIFIWNGHKWDTAWQHHFTKI